MELISIQLHNFLCYHGNNNNFKFTPGLNLILGANGYGKSKLYDAFNWVFFDGITNQKGERINTRSLKSNLISRKAIEKSALGKVECKVVIELKGENEVFQIERKYFINKTKDKIIEADNSTERVFVKNDLQYIPYQIEEGKFFDFVRDEIIPTDVFQHIWFQGERGITRAIDTSSGKTLLNVINKISYIDMWQRYVDIAEDALRRVNKSFENEVRKSNRKAKERKILEVGIKKLKDSLTANIKELATRKDELLKITYKIDSISLSTEAQERINLLKKEEDELKRNLLRVKDRLNNVIDLADRNVFGEYWVIHKTQYLGNQFDRLYRDYVYEKQSLIEKAKENLPQIPRGNPDATHIHKMLEDCHCHICDRPAPKDSPFYKNIKRLLPENYPTSKPSGAEYIHEKTFEKLSKVQLGLQLNVNSFEQDASNATESYYKLEQERVELEERIQGIKDNKSLVLSDLGLDSLDAGIRKGQNYKDLNNESGRLNNIIGRLENQLLKENREKEGLEDQYQKLFANEIDDGLKKQMQFFKSLVVATKDAKESQFQMLVELLESETNKHYENINKESGAFYGEIKFHKNNQEGYTARIHNNDGDDVTNNMNTSQILSMQLSILFAILSTNKQKGLNKHYPLIADAPNASFDPEKRKFLLLEMGRTFDQSIIMMFEYLEKDPDRDNRYRINQKELKGLKKEMKESDIGLNIIHLDIPDKINPKKLQDLSIDIKPL